MCLAPFGYVMAAFGSQKWRDRMGLARIKTPCDIWIHASSVGEVNVIANLVNYIRAQRPELRLHITTMTSTGQANARKKFSKHSTTSFIPLDTPLAVAATLRKLKPRLLVIAETEIWPNLISQCHRRNVPIVLVNGRMTEKSSRQYLKLKSFFASILCRYDRFFFKTEDDAARYSLFGIDVSRTEVAGNMKFDAPLVEKNHDLISQTRKGLFVGDDEFLFVAGSTRKGENELIIRMIKELRDQSIRVKTILVPRHIECASSIVEIASSFGFKADLIDKANNNSDLIVVNKMGLLNDIYLAADLAFVGGTLVDIGGHNLLEPVWAGTPVLFGPSVHGVHDAAEYVISHDFGKQVAHIEELSQVMRACILKEQSFAIKQESDLSRSATARAGTYILKLLNDD